MAPTPAEAAKNADVVLVCVGNDDDVRAVVLGESGVLSAVSRRDSVDHHGFCRPGSGACWGSPTAR